MSKHPNTCKHNKVSGYQALEALLTAQHRNHVCSSRMTFLALRVKEFKKHVEEQGEDFSILVLETKEKLEAIWREGEGEVSDMQVDSIPPMDFHEHRFNEEAACLQQFSAQFWGNVTKALSKYHQDQRMRSIAVESEAIRFLKRAQDEYLNPEVNKEQYLSKQTWRVVKLARERLKRLRFDDKVLNYNQWAMLTNWANRLLSNDKRYNPGKDMDVWEELSKQDLFLWSSREEDEQEEECRVLDEIHISDHYADMSKVTVTKLKPLPNRKRAQLFQHEEHQQWEQWKSAGYPVK